MRLIGIIVLCLFAVAVPARSQTIVGTVVDSSANTRVSAAQIMLLQHGVATTATTDSLGMFRFSAKAGPFMLRIRALGYSEILSPAHDLAHGENVNVRILVAPMPIAVAPIHADARMRPMTALSQFNERMNSRSGAGSGIFFDANKIERMSAVTVNDIMRRVPGASVTNEFVSLRPHCQDAVYLLDGMPVRGMEAIPGVDRGGEGTATSVINTMVSAFDIAGIEVYKGDVGIPGPLLFALSGVPAESRACGVVAIWTKR